MSKVILGWTMSLDGYINDSHGSVAALYPDLETLPETEALKESIQNTGAVVMGRNSFAMAEDPDWFVGIMNIRCRFLFLPTSLPKNIRRSRSS